MPNQEPASAWIFGNSSVRVGTQGLFCPYLKTFVPPFSQPDWLPLGLRGRYIRWYILVTNSMHFLFDFIYDKEKRKGGGGLRCSAGVAIPLSTSTFRILRTSLNCSPVSQNYFSLCSKRFPKTMRFWWSIRKESQGKLGSWKIVDRYTWVDVVWTVWRNIYVFFRFWHSPQIEKLGLHVVACLTIMLPFFNRWN